MAREARGGGVVAALARIVLIKVVLTVATAVLAFAAPDNTLVNETKTAADVAANLMDFMEYFPLFTHHQVDENSALRGEHDETVSNWQQFYCDELFT
jgi:hypothetical protein